MNLKQKIHLSYWKKTDTESKFSKSELEILKEVYRVYGSLEPEYLRDLSHEETPWKDARANIPKTFGSDRPISEKSMKSYYTHFCNENGIKPQILKEATDMNKKTFITFELKDGTKQTAKIDEVVEFVEQNKGNLKTKKKKVNPLVLSLGVPD